MTKVFGDIYADIYDFIYEDKNYNEECNLIEKIMHEYGKKTGKKILDLGCGTGSHAVILAERGYDVTGVDISQGMLDLANKKKKKINKPNYPKFVRGDIRNIKISQKFDVVLSMFAVLGYQKENADVLSALKTARCHLTDNGLFIFDFWYGPSVLYHKPVSRIKVINIPSGKIIRVANGDLNILEHNYTVKYLAWRIKKGCSLEEIEECHTMRFFFPLEIRFFLESAGFELLKLAAFPTYINNPSEDSWNVIAVAKAI